MPTRRSARSGFTLIEALVALALLMVGVYAVLRIFPIGFTTVGYARNVQVATRLAEQEIERVLAEPANLPRRIIATDAVGNVLLYDPDDVQYDAAPYSEGTVTISDGSTTVNGSSTHWLDPASQVLPGCLFHIQGAEDWYVITRVESDTKLILDRPHSNVESLKYDIERPSWEPDAIFLPRTIVGETVEIPRPRPDPSAALPVVPKHVLAFGPILPLHWDEALSEDNPVVVYSTRYYPVADPSLLGSGEDRFQYVIDNTTGVLTFDSVPYERRFKVDYSWVKQGESETDLRIQSKVNELFTLAANQTVYALAPEGAPLGLDEQVAPDSERVYLRFKYLDSGTPGRGEFTMTQVGRILGVVEFSPDDAPATVMIDYRTADWQIMREDKQVGDGGLARLTVFPARRASYRNPPRQAQPLYADSANSREVAAVDLDTGEALYGWPAAEFRYARGTATATTGSKTVTGSGTRWTTYVLPGYYFRLNVDDKWYKIDTVDTDDQITLTQDYAETGGKGQYVIAMPENLWPARDESDAGFPDTATYSGRFAVDYANGLVHFTDTYAVGTAQATNGSASVTGVGTEQWRAYVRPDDWFRIEKPDGEWSDWYVIARVVSATQKITLAQNYGEASASGDYEIMRKAYRLGRTYRIYYRTVEDWGVRVSKAAHRYYRSATFAGAQTDHTDQIYSLVEDTAKDVARLIFPLSERGKSVLVDYTIYPASAEDPQRHSGELHTIPHTGQDYQGEIHVPVDFAAGDKIGIHKVVGASLEATTIWADRNRGSEAKGAIYSEGTASVTRGSATVTGAGTQWATFVRRGDAFRFEGHHRWYAIAGVVSDTEITLRSPYAGPSASGPYVIKRAVGLQERLLRRRVEAFAAEGR